MSFERDYDLFPDSERYVTVKFAKQMQDTAFFLGLAVGALAVTGFILFVNYLV